MPSPLFLLFENWIWCLLMAALVLHWAGRATLGWATFAAWCAIALFTDHITWGALAMIGAGLGLALLPKPQSWLINLGRHLLFVIWGVAMAAHLVPGFTNVQVLDQVLSGPQSAPYSLHLNLDKPVVFIALLLFAPTLLQPTAARGRAWHLAAVALALALFPLALALGALRWEPSVPHWLLIFLLANLLQTCLVEEAFFRGYLQKTLIARFGATAGIAGASVLFGLAHAGGGPVLILFAGLLGLACGLIHWAGGRLAYAVGLHFLFNCLHLLLFTYPLAA